MLKSLVKQNIGAVIIWLFCMLSKYRGVPTVMITLAIVLLVYSFITSKTVMGRRLYAIGGASAYGGVGTVGGALIMGMLNYAMSILGISQDAQQMVKGLVLLAAVAFDVISKQKVQISFFSKLKIKK